MSKKPELYDYYQELIKKAESEKVATLQEVLEFYSSVLRTDIDEVMEFDGFGARPKSFKDMGSAKSLVHKFKFRKGQGTEVELYSKENAARELMRHYGAYAPIKNEHTGKDGGPIEVKDTTDYSSLSPAELETLLNLLEKANEGED